LKFGRDVDMVMCWYCCSVISLGHGLEQSSLEKWN
jgi:hypothetical protein